MNRRTGLIAVWIMLCLGSVASAEGRRELKFPDLPGLKTLKCDFHVHTVFSDGLVWPSLRVDEAWRQGLDAIAMTDHIEYQPHKADLPPNYNRSYEIAAARGKDRNIIVIHGAEITHDTPPGHFNALFLDDTNPLKTEDLSEQIQRAADQKAFVFWNHPYWQGAERGQWADAQQQPYEKKQLQGIEICNGDEYCAQAHQWAIEKGLTITGDSDIHEPASDLPFTPEDHRTLTLVFAKERSVEGIHEALMAGRTAVWCKNQLYGNEQYLAALFAGAVEVRPVHHRTRDDVRFEVVNRSELDIQLSVGKTKDKDPLVLPAGATTMMRLSLKRIDDSGMAPFRVENFITAPDKVLEVKLAIPDSVAK